MAEMVKLVRKVGCDGAYPHVEDLGNKVPYIYDTVHDKYFEGEIKDGMAIVEVCRDLERRLYQESDPRPGGVLVRKS